MGGNAGKHQAAQHQKGSPKGWAAEDRRRSAADARSASKSSRRRWSKRVTQTSNAMDLDGGVFTQSSARSIALSLKRSAERSQRRKSEPFRSAMSMLNLYINRAGRNLSPARRRVLERAKAELRRAFHRE